MVGLVVPWLVHRVLNLPRVARPVFGIIVVFRIVGVIFLAS